MNRRIPKYLTDRARELRNNPTPAELAIWHRISRYRPAFTRQHIEVPFIIDLACRKAKLAIEFDGSQHLEAIEEDQRRTAHLESLGWKVIRLWNSEVLGNPDGSVMFILNQLAECLGDTHPAPGETAPGCFRSSGGRPAWCSLPSREGRKRRPRFG